MVHDYTHVNFYFTITVLLTRYVCPLHFKNQLYDLSPRYVRGSLPLINPKPKKRGVYQSLGLGFTSDDQGRGAYVICIATMMKILTNKITIEISIFSHKSHVFSDETYVVMNTSDKAGSHLKTMVEQTHNRLFRLCMTLFILFAIHIW